MMVNSVRIWQVGIAHKGYRYCQQFVLKIPKPVAHRQRAHALSKWARDVHDSPYNLIESNDVECL